MKKVYENRGFYNEQEDALLVFNDLPYEIQKTTINKFKLKTVQELKDLDLIKDFEYIDNNHEWESDLIIYFKEELQ